MDTKQMCMSDSDCGDNYLCSFDNNDLNHYCVKNLQSNLYQGCLVNMNNVNYIDSKSKNDTENIKGCIDFSRRQINEDGFNYNFFVYKPKRKTFVDTTTVNIYLKCDEEILAVIPYADYFELKCNDSFEECKLISKDGLYNFIKQNTRNVKTKSSVIYLEFDYLCDNENIRKSQKKTITNDDINTNKKIVLSLSCPVNTTDETYQTKCSSIFMDDISNNNVDNSVSLDKCKYPLFRTPYIVKDKKKYEDVKKNANERESKRVEEEIKLKMDEVKRLKIEKYMKDNNLSYKEAEIIIEEKENKNKNASWMTFNMTDAASFFLNSPKYSDFITMYDSDVKTFEEAKKIAELNNKIYFVWFHNNYNNKEYSSKLFFISNVDSDNKKIDVNIYDKNLFKKDQNVTTCIYNNNIEAYDNELESANNLQYYTFTQILDLITESSLKTSLTNDDTSAILQNIDSKNNLNDVVLKKIDNKIMTMQQKVKMSEYEDKVNDKILSVIRYILFFVFVIGLIIIIYLNQKYSTIKLIGK
jgi:hypothetical protein